MGVKKTARVGRPSKYTQELADKICRLIAEGMSLRAICEDSTMPHRDTVASWLCEKPDFSDQYARAREDQADFYTDQIIEIADTVEPDAASVAKAKLQIDARKWKASKLAPKKYGDKVEQVLSGTVAVEARPFSSIFESDD